jgi:hypothetical protein
MELVIDHKLTELGITRLVGVVVVLVGVGRNAMVSGEERPMRARQ